MRRFFRLQPSVVVVCLPYLDAKGFRGGSVLWHTARALSGRRLILFFPPPRASIGLELAFAQIWRTPFFGAVY